MNKDLPDQNLENRMPVENRVEAASAVVEEKRFVAFENLKALNKMAQESQGGN